MPTPGQKCKYDPHLVVVVVVVGSSSSTGTAAKTSIVEIMHPKCQ